MSTKKNINEIILKLVVVNNLEDRKYVWECKARQTIFETIKLPHDFVLKEIKTDP
jgi:hypothetical protein